MSLSQAAGYTVVGSIEQIREPDPRFQIGKGKAEELANLVKELGAEKIIFSNELKPIQVYNLAKLTGVEAIDRFQLILEIFVRRASTREAKLQIQLAKLRYELSHSREKVRLAKMGEQPGFHGLGRYQVDVYYEAIKRQVVHIQSELKKIRQKRGLHRLHRRELGFSTVSLAGYTNAGKSTIFNSLAKESIPVDPGLFTTLSTTIRAVDFVGRKTLLIDTVGFIDNLPLGLIEAFRSTLEETIFSDVILLLVDVSEPLPEIKRKLLCCLDIIREIGAVYAPIVTAFNKIDLLKPDELKERMDYLEEFAPNPVPVSALYGQNLDKLKREIARYLKNYVKGLLILPLDKKSMSYLSELYAKANVLEVSFQGNKIEVQIEALSWFMDKVRGYTNKFGGELQEWAEVSE